MPQKDWKSQLTQILERLSALDEKYEGLGQDMLSYLDGLYYSNGLTYWDYIHMDSLLGLQMPRTPFKDEIIFITYHQMTELMFKLVKLELDALSEHKGDQSEYLHLRNWQKRMGRAKNYFRHLANSFDIMLSGLDTDEMQKFRMALLPASGFQSAQFREIEIMSTELPLLLKGELPEEPHRTIEEMYPFMYWKQGGIDLETGQKTLTLRMFEDRYDEEFLQLIHRYKARNIYHLYQRSAPEIREDETLREILRDFDQHVNVFWKLSHLSAAARHLTSGPAADGEGTGGTNWRTFLPPKFQRVTFFPGLWSEEELTNWGKAAFLKYFQQNVSQGWMKTE